MCWSEEVSWITFALGLVISLGVAWSFRHVPLMVTLTVAWQCVVFMEFFEAFVWRQINGVTDNMFGTYGAIFTAMLQPIFMSCVLMTLDNIPRVNRILASYLILQYIYWYSYALVSMSPMKYLEVNNPSTCNHIDFSFWEHLFLADYFYSFTFISLLLLLIRPIDVAYFIIALCGGVFCLTYFLYNCGESNGSMWCWMSSCMMGFIGLYWYLVHEIRITSSLGCNDHNKRE